MAYPKLGTSVHYITKDGHHRHAAVVGYSRAYRTDENDWNSDPYETVVLQYNQVSTEFVRVAIGDGITAGQAMVVSAQESKDGRPLSYHLADDCPEGL